MFRFFFMSYFLLYVEAHHPNSQIPNVEWNCSIDLHTIYKNVYNTVNFGYGNHTFVEISHFVVHVTSNRNIPAGGLKFHNYNQKKYELSSDIKISIFHLGNQGMILWIWSSTFKLYKNSFLEVDILHYVE